MKKFFTIEHILLIVAAIIAIFLILSYFKKGNEGLSEKDKAILAAKDETIKATQAERDAYKLMADNERNSKDQLRIADSISLANLYRSQQLFQQTINEKLRNIPISISHIANNDDSIRLYFARFQ